MNLTGLNANLHRDLKLRQPQSLDHTRHSHAVSIAVAEIPRAALSYPVMFVRNDSGFQPVALLSLVPNENQFLDGDAWQASYIPAAVRVYPFQLYGEQVLIDTESAALSTAEGEALFNESSEPTALLNERLDFLRACQAADAETQRWCTRLAERGLLVERHADVVSPAGVHYQLDGFYTVDGEKLAALPDADLANLLRDNSLMLIHAHMLSLDNLIGLAAQRDKPAASHAKPEAGTAPSSKGKRRDTRSSRTQH